jgi:hypothetical protein
MSENLENRDSCSVKYFSYFVSLSSIDMFWSDIISELCS